MFQWFLNHSYLVAKKFFNFISDPVLHDFQWMLLSNSKSDWISSENFDRFLSLAKIIFVRGYEISQSIDKWIIYLKLCNKIVNYDKSKWKRRAYS